ncbi:SIP domain-containing protein [Cardiobacteriaceae bacterium TAE3-ERU3]|nr:SIP domain-containing protein [Cardiobacteriaceae bacterium TAE3-ERU3]
MTQYTPITDQDQKLDIIEHVNQDHPEELLTLTQSFSDYPNATSATIVDMYNEGILIRVQPDNIETFIPFQIKGELEEQILYLAYLAMSKQGKSFDNRKQFFTVISSEHITPNMLRIHIESPAPLPENSPGYAYWFALKTLAKQPDQPVQETANNWTARLFNRGLLWLMKHLSSQRRNQILRSMNKGARYYTLRNAWRSDDGATFADRGSIDVFLHGDTPGSNWARGLKAGDIIHSQAETADKHAHLHQGKALLIADETAYPALAGILDHWQNASPPHIIILSTADSEQGYFTDESFPAGSNAIRITCSPEQQGERTIAAIKSLTTIDCAWGALESESAKAIRHHLRNQRLLSGKNNHVKAYWRLRSDEA